MGAVPSLETCETCRSKHDMEWHYVELAVSEFPMKDWVFAAVSGMKGYHSSIVVDSREWFFSSHGIMSNSFRSGAGEIPASHLNKLNTEVIPLNMTKNSDVTMLKTLERFFEPGSYDLLHKNCNAFTDCAMAFLVSQRLNPKYTSLEELATGHPEWLDVLSRGKYKANPKAVGFSVESVIMKIDPNAWMRTDPRQ
eukprot:gnl/MRDRNA2_/MRDRNA2_17524_c0_seq1.p1 gnl/MRDRNA2_/MRDRNA2_17524_c0~~gnl/MRDRNA2_/MRDRNA2_17524_c0_seq1.p1  ORF type:complete len:195 (+),score=26.91 gnl/MRDRNA2_/MRDRNA2_17524_c0_seq1:75-659(+)